MCPGIDDTVVLTVVRQVCVGCIQRTMLHVEGKLKDFHAGEVVRITQSLHIFGDDPKVLSDDRKILPKFLFQGSEELLSGGFHPGPVHCRLFALRYFPIGSKTTEVVYSDDVTALERLFNTLDPPTELLLAMRFPIIDGISPKLSVGGEGIGGNSA
ncbi:hypothetical protein SDC9_115955 [bioreactor metagenome]|uniref:Uncharacterized protein n=1 Tax=bioreactor metagenome TaxID=1076179 RepID=A0A645BUT3_9ZZZZ